MIKNILSLLLLLALGLPMQGQCPGCVVNTSCGTGSTTAVMCPDNLPAGTVMQAYDQDVTVFIPHSFPYNVPGLGLVTINVNQVQIMGFYGLPFGINWQTNVPGNVFYPSSNPPASEYGCMKLCGTPLLAGTYQVTVTASAIGSYGSITQNQQIDLDFEMVVLPGSSNPVFSMSNPSGCGSVTNHFTALIESNGSPSYHYSWEFGNGNTSSSEFPPDQVYPAPGTYPVSQSTVIVNQNYQISSVQVTGVSCNDNFFTYQEAPDLFIIIKQGTTTLYTSPIANNITSHTFSFNPINLAAQTYTIQVWDDDVIDADDNCGTVNFAGNVAGLQNMVSGGLQINFLIALATDSTSFSATDTVLVLPQPVVDLGPDTQYPANETVSLQASNPGSSFYWSNGSTASTITVSQSGTYSVLVSHPAGCQASDMVNIIIGPNNPDLQSTDVTCPGNTNGSIDLTYIGGPGATFQWSTGANTSDLSGLAAGTYQVTITDASQSIVAQGVVSSPPPLQISSAVIPASCSTCLNGAIDLSLAGGSPPFSIGWSNGLSTEDLVGLNPDTFFVYILDQQGCYAWDTVEVGLQPTGIQTLDLPFGWSLFSTYIYPENPQLTIAMAPIVPFIKIMKSGGGLVYWPQFNINGIGSLQIGQGYQINMTQAHNHSFQGLVAIPELTPIAVPQGWSLIGYLRQTPGSMPTMLQSLAGKIVIAKNGAGQVYWPSVNLNGIGNMIPGQGYQINLTQAGSLLYPAN
jgi:hypothetical protein